uniref:Mitogen-activated protein kinase kinase 5 n=1 Tax=Gadus morhua TaxID=8049 RepID=A0A8C5BV81_GADMO
MLLLVLNNIYTMETEGIVIRIKTPSGDMDSSVDCPSLLNFNDLLVAIRDVMPEATVTAFEYEDEVGDRITVRSDEELKAMLSYYCNTMNEQRINGLLPEPLQIFPRAGKTPGIRNIHGLKVNTRPSAAHECSQATPEPVTTSSLKKSSAELKKILTNGQMNAQDIHCQEQLGHGNGGTVYKAYHVLGKRVLAVKVIPLDITEELQRQIMSELEILYKCDSPYIITFYTAFFVENRISICTEFMDVQSTCHHDLSKFSTLITVGNSFGSSPKANANFGAAMFQKPLNCRDKRLTGYLETGNSRSLKWFARRI